MNKLKLYISLAFILSVIIAKSQIQLPDSIDSFIKSNRPSEEKVEMILDFAVSNTVNDQKIALHYFDSAYRFAKSFNHDSLIVSALSRKSRFFLDNSLYDSAKYYATQVNEMINDPESSFSENEKHTHLSDFAEILYKSGLPDTAEILSKRVLEYAKKANDSGLIFRSNGNLAMYYGTKGRFSEAIAHIKESLRFSIKRGDSAVGYIRLSIVNLKMNGKITVKSSEHEGSTFRISLPAYSDTLKYESAL